MQKWRTAVPHRNVTRSVSSTDVANGESDHNYGDHDFTQDEVIVNAWLNAADCIIMHDSSHIRIINFSEDPSILTWGCASWRWAFNSPSSRERANHQWSFRFARSNSRALMNILDTRARGLSDTRYGVLGRETVGRLICLDLTLTD